MAEKFDWNALPTEQPKNNPQNPSAFWDSVPSAEPEPVSNEPRSMFTRLTGGGLPESLDEVKERMQGWGQQGEEPITGTPPLATPQSAMPKAVQTLANFLGRGQKGGIAARTATGALEGAAGGVDPRNLEFSPQAAISGALGGGALGGISRPLEKIGDVGMQMAVGRKKYGSGVGTELIEEGIKGSRRGMRKQVGEALKRRGAELGQAAEGITQPIDASQIASEVSDQVLSPYQIPGAEPSRMDQAAVSKLSRLIDDIKSRGAESASTALGRRKAAGYSSWGGRDNPLSSAAAKGRKAEQAAYSKALKEAGGPEFEALDRRYSALKKAEKGLEGDSLPSGVFEAISKPFARIPGLPSATSQLSTAVGKAGARSSRAPIGLAAIIQQLSEQDERTR